MAAEYKNALIRITGPDLLALRDEFKKLPKNIAATVIGAGLKRAAQPAENALKKVTPAGPTGNLRRAIKTIVKRYPRDGAAVAVVGYVKAGTGKSKSAKGGTVKKGPDRAFHQFWLEFGTKDRVVSMPAILPYTRARRGERKRLRRLIGKKMADEHLKNASNRTRVQQQGGYIASSFNRLGPFKLKTTKGGTGRVQTSPKYPKAFFRKSNDPIQIPAVGAQRPVARAFSMSKAAIASNLTAEMTKALVNGKKIVEDRARRAAQMKDLGKFL